MSDIDTKTAAVKTQWQAKIDAQTGIDPLIKAEAELVLERYTDAISDQASLEEGIIQSYTIAGRTFTYKTAAQASKSIEGLRNELISLVFGDVTLVNMNENGNGETLF